jgi:hypothetical protein
MQQWRGVPSHFNYSTPFDAAVFNIMGTMIVLVEIVIVLIALWTFFSLKAPPSLAWAIRLGMVLLVVSQIFGNLIIANGIPQVLDFQSGEFISEGVNSAYIFGAAGSMKVPVQSNICYHQEAEGNYDYPCSGGERSDRSLVSCSIT